MSAVPSRIDHLETPAMHQSKLGAVAWGLVVMGIAGLAGAFATGDAPRAWSAVLMGMLVPTLLAAGGLFFIAAHALCGARWTVPFIRVMEGATAGLPLAILGLLAVGTVGLPFLYDWAGDESVRATLFADPHGSKAAWMQGWRFLLTGLAILAAWVVAGRVLAARSRAVDDESRARLARVAAATLVLLVPTCTLLTWDTLLSLDVRFTSAIFGAYVLVGAIHAFLGAFALAVVWLRRRGLAQVAQPHLLNDIGTWMMAWSCIVGYIAFCQYLIVSFTNLDEDGSWFLMRLQHGYGDQATAVVVLRCVIPFALLLSRRLRPKAWAVGAAGASILLASWLELDWLVAPAFSPNHYRVPFGPEFLVAVGFLAATLLLAIRHWRRRGLVPDGDPRLLPAINAEHLS